MSFFLFVLYLVLSPSSRAVGQLSFAFSVPPQDSFLSASWLFLRRPVAATRGQSSHNRVGWEKGSERNGFGPKDRHPVRGTQSDLVVVCCTTSRVPSVQKKKWRAKSTPLCCLSCRVWYVGGWPANATSAYVPTPAPASEHCCAFFFFFLLLLFMIVSRVIACLFIYLKLFYLFSH